MSKFDPTKPVRTRDGRQVRIVSTRTGGVFPIMALIIEADRDRPVFVTADGRRMAFPGDHDEDLVNVNVDATFWLGAEGDVDA